MITAASAGETFPMQHVSTVNIEWMKKTTPTTKYYSEGRIR